MKQNLKKALWGCLCGLLCVAVLVGCGMRRSPEAEATTELLVEGTVEQYTEDTLEILAGETSFIFSLKKVDPSVLPVTMVGGSRVIVTYEGEPGKSNCKILKIQLIERDIAPENAIEADSSSSQITQTRPTSELEVTGTIVDASMHSILLEDAEGNQYPFNYSMDDTVVFVDAPSNLAIGSTVLAGYNGAIDDPECTLIFLVETATPEGEAVLPLQSVIGTVKKSDAASISITEGEPSKSYTFAIDTKTENHIPGTIAVEAQVEVQYRGDYQDGMAAVAIFAK